MFALLYTQLLLLFVRGEWNRRLLPRLSINHGQYLAPLFGRQSPVIILGNQFARPNIPQ